MYRTSYWRKIANLPKSQHSARESGSENTSLSEEERSAEGNALVDHVSMDFQMLGLNVCH